MDHRRLNWTVLFPEMITARQNGRQSRVGAKPLASSVLVGVALRKSGRSGLERSRRHGSLVCGVITSLFWLSCWVSRKILLCSERERRLERIVLRLFAIRRSAGLCCTNLHKEFIFSIMTDTSPLWAKYVADQERPICLAWSWGRNCELALPDRLCDGPPGIPSGRGRSASAGGAVGR